MALLFLNELADSLSNGVIPSNMKNNISHDMFDLSNMKYHYVNYLVGRVSCSSNIRLEVASPSLLPKLLKSQAEYFVLWVDQKPISLFAIVPSHNRPIIKLQQSDLIHYLKTFYYYPRA